MRLEPGVLIALADVCSRRVSPIAVRPGEGLLTERTAAVQPMRRERVSCPLNRRCRRTEQAAVPYSSASDARALKSRPSHIGGEDRTHRRQALITEELAPPTAFVSP